MQNSFKRLDAHLSSLGYCTRSEIKKFLKMFHVSVDGVRVSEPKQKVYHSQVEVEGEKLDPEVLLVALHKPSGVVCSHNDSGVLIYSLLPLRWQNRTPKLSTIGRLDSDTTGIILLTDDGQLNHRLTSPKHEHTKVYEVTLAQALRGDEEEVFASGTLMLKGESKPLLPAKMQIQDSLHVKIEICEGRYHQVKRMFAALGNRVVALHRVQFGEYNLDGLSEGEYKLIL